MTKEKAVKSASNIDCMVSGTRYDSEMSTETVKNDYNIMLSLWDGHHGKIDVTDFKWCFLPCL